MADIFDQVAAASPGVHDIFDEVAEPATPKGSSTDDAAARFADPFANAPAHPAVPLPGSSTDRDTRSASERLHDQVKVAGGEGDLDGLASAGDAVLHGPKTLVQGLKDVYTPQPGEQGTGVAGERGIGAIAHPMTPQEQAQANSNVMSGAAKAISGAGETALTLDAPGIGGTATRAVLGGPGRWAARKALLTIAGGFAAGTVTEKVADSAAEKLGFSSGARELTNAVAFFLPTLAGAAAGARMESVEHGESGGVAASAFGDRFKAGVASTPDTYGASVKFGDKQFDVRVARNSPDAMVPSAAENQGKQATADAISALARRDQQQSAASNVAQGVLPPQPPKPPMPQGMDEGQLSPQTVTSLSRAISLAPEETRGQLVMEAHENLAKWIGERGRIIGPDGKIHIADSPKAAASLAAKFINDEVARQDAERDSNTERPAPVEPGKEKVVDPLLARATAFLEAHPDARIPQLQRQLRVGYGQATELWNQFHRERVASATPTIGSKAEPVVEEKPQTVENQLDSLVRGTINVVMIPKGSAYRPAVPEGMKMMGVDGDAPGAGLYIYNPQKIRAATIREAAKAGTHGDLLGHIQTKAEIANAPETVTVQASAPDGTVIQDSEVDASKPDIVRDQAEALAERHPGAVIDVKPTEQILAERAAEQPVALNEGDSEVEKGGSGESPEQAGGVEKSAPSPDEVKASAGRYLTDNLEDSVTKYRETNTGGGVLHVSSDAAREILPGYGTPAERTANTFHLGAASSQLAAEVWRRAMAAGPQGDQYIVEFLTGSPGSGKTASTIDGAEPSSIAIVSEGMMDHFERSAERVQQSIDAGFVPTLRLVYADDPRITLRRAVARAMAHGRPVAISQMGRLYVEIPKTVHRLADHFGNKLGVSVFNNSLDGRSPVETTLEKALTKTRTYTVETAKEAMRDELDRVRSTGKVSPEVYAQFAGAADSAGSSKDGRSKGTEDHGSSAREDGTGREGPRAVKEVAGHNGKEISLLTPTQKLPARYRLVEADDLIPSHNAHTFAKNAAYPDGVQERQYHTEKEAQNRVIQQAQNYDADYTINTNPDAVNGPPVITPSGIVLGGNSRTMSTQRAYALGKQGRAYRDRLASSAGDYGFRRGQVEEMRKPMLVRQVEEPATKEAMHSLGRDLNKSKTGALSMAEKAVSAGKTITEDTLTRVADILHEASGEEPATLRSVMSEPKYAREIVRMMTADGVITTEERPQYVETSTGGLSEQGKLFVEHALLGAIVDDAELMTAAPRDVLSKVGSNLGALMSLNAREDGWNIIPILRGALAEHAEVAKRDTTVALYLDNGDMFGPARNTAVDAMTRKLSESGKVARVAIRDFAADAMDSASGQIRLLDGVPEPFSSFNKAFDANLTEDEFAKNLADAETHIPSREAKKKAARKALSEADTPAASDAASAEKKAKPVVRPEPTTDETRSSEAVNDLRRSARPLTVNGVMTGWSRVMNVSDVILVPASGERVVTFKNESGDTAGFKAALRKAQSWADANRTEIPNLSKKGDIVRFHDASNIVRTGRVVFADDRIVRIKSGTDVFKVKHTDILGPADAETSGTSSLADELYDKIAKGEMPKTNADLKKLVAERDGVEATNLALKTGQEALEAAMVRRARDIVRESKDDAETFDKLVDLYNSQPVLNIRTSTSIENQAYSTPAPLAFVASKLAGIDAASKVYEPTAGNGMLLIGAKPSNVTAGELEPGRAENLRALEFDVIEGDALEANVPPESMDAVIANPPFGSVKENGKPVKVSVDGFKIGKVDHLIVARALDAMKDDGRGSFIIGADKVAGGQGSDDRIFFNWLYSHYNVVGHFEVDGALYNRQGANWPVRVITVDGRVASKKVAPMPGTIQRVSTWPEVYERLNQSVGADSERRAEAGAGSGVVAPGDGNDARPVRGQAENADGDANLARPESRGSSVERDGGEQPRPVRGRSENADKPVRASSDDVRPDADVAESDRLAKGQKRERSNTPKPSDSGRTGSVAPLAAEENQFQAVYKPASSKKDAGVLIPTNMQQPLAQAMRKLEEAVGDVDAFARKELGYDSIDDLHDALMGLQVDSAASAIHQISQSKGIIIGDQTGIGKGRQAAAILRWAHLHDKTPIFLTVKDQLFTDMFADLADIGTNDVHPLLVNADAAITLPNGQKAYRNSLTRHRRVLEEIAETGKLPTGSNAVFLTYSQINKDNMQRRVLNALASNAVIVLDESHNAGGDSNTGEFVQNLLKEVYGCVYLSATYAKRPDNMPVYHRTDIGQAVADKEALSSAMAQGGLPLQTVVSNNLVKAGQMFRRERSYDGVEIKAQTITRLRKQHVALSDAATEALRAITDADRAFHDVYVPWKQQQVRETMGADVAGGGNKADAMVQHTEFSSVVHNFVRQMLLGLKVDDAADQAIEAIKEGKKPLIALENTMGSFLSEFVAERGLRPGDSVADLDYRTVLERALTRSRSIVIKHANGDESRVPVGLHELDPETSAAYAEAQKVIDGLEIDIPVSPVDHIRQKLSDAGHSVAEITGRDLAINYADPKNPKLTQISAQEQNDKVETTRRFNDGRLDAVILNVSGSTGISLHASERFADQRKRKMIVVQPAQDINIFMQMLGRIHRTGQVQLPEYSIVSADLPAEKRPTALLAKKMKSLNANTSSNTESATSVQAADMLNKYGDAIVAAYLQDNPLLADRLNVEPVGEDGKPTADLARKATGRLAILPVAEQEAFYGEVEQMYNDHIAYLEATNQNDLEPRTFDFDAKLKRSHVLVEATDPTSPFGEAATYGEYSIKMQAKPIGPAEVREAIDRTLGGKAAKDVADGLLARLNRDLETYISTLEPGSESVNKARELAHKTTQFIRSHEVGSTIRIDINGDLYSAAVVDVQNSHKGTGNPFALSKLKVRLATAGPLRWVAPAATEFERLEVAKLTDKPESIFSLARVGDREEAKIITGNLLAAFGEMQNSQGKIINFTTEGGTTEQGILLPKKFDIAKNIQGDIRIADAGDVASILKENTSSETANRFGIASRDGNVRILTEPSGRLRIVTPKSRAKGGQYFLDKNLTSIVGDFASVANQMRAYIPSGSEAEAIAAIQKKAALYAPASLANEARAYLQRKEAGKQKKPSSGTTLHASVFGVDILAKFMAEQGKAFYEKDVAPALRTMSANGAKAGTQIAAVLYPRIGANKDALDSIMKAKGERERHRFTLEHLMGGLSKFFDKMSRDEHIAFIDRYKLGVGQIDPHLQEIENLMRAIDEASLREAQRYKPNLAAKEDHYRVIWKVIPGTKVPGKSRVGSGRRPFEGDKGFMKRATLETISEGINAGGEPISTNPWKMFSMAQGSMMQFITAQRYWDDLKGLGLRKFANLTKPQDRPEGWMEVPDRLANIYFPAASGEGMIHAGKWYVEPSAGRLLVNFLSRDHIRESAVGNAMMVVKNLTTAIELGLSPFHFLFESVEGVGTQFGLGIQRFWNVGVREWKPAEMLRGAKDAVTAVAGPVMMARDGGSLLRLTADVKNFAATNRGAKFLDEFPEGAELLDDLFTGGLTWGMNEDFRFDPMKSMREAASESNFVGAALRAVPALEHYAMKPLFEVYIPRLKAGYALKQYAQQLAERQADLQTGKVTRAEIARAVIDSAENRFGEMNFSNLFWDNTFKSAMQLMFRSVTWKLGNWRGFLTAAGKETYENFADPLHAMYEDVLAGKKQRPTSSYIPKIGMNQAWLLGVAVTTAVISSITTYLFTGQWPWDFIDRDDDLATQAGNLAFEMTHPRTGRTSDSSGKPERLSVPTGLKDFEHGFRDPKGYLHGSMSGVVSHAIDTWDNRDFFGNYVYDPNAPAYRQFAQGMAYNLPKPIVAESMRDSAFGRNDTETKALKFAGFNPSSSSDHDFTSAERMMRELIKARLATPKTPDEVEALELANADSSSNAKRPVRDGEYLKKLFHRITYIDARKVFDSATDEERRQLAPLLRAKRSNVLERKGGRAVIARAEKDAE